MRPLAELFHTSPAEVHASCCTGGGTLQDQDGQEGNGRETRGHHAYCSDTYTYSPMVSWQEFMSSRRAAWYRKHRLQCAEAPEATHTTIVNPLYWIGRADTPLWWALVWLAGCVARALAKDCGRALMRKANRVAETARYLALLPLATAIIYTNGWQSYVGWCE